MAFHEAFCYGVHHHYTSQPDLPKHGLTFPLTQSVVMSTLVLPFLPIFTPQQAESLVIKKTSYKNARKFIKSLDKQKLVLTKDRPGNEVDILDIDFEDTSIRDFQPYRLPKKQTSTEKSNSNSNGTESAGVDDSIGQKLKKVDLYKPHDKLADILKASNARYAHDITHSPISPANTHLAQEHSTHPPSYAPSSQPTSNRNTSSPPPTNATSTSIPPWHPPSSPPAPRASTTKSSPVAPCPVTHSTTASSPPAHLTTPFSAMGKTSQRTSRAPARRPRLKSLWKHAVGIRRRRGCMDSRSMAYVRSRWRMS